MKKYAFRLETVRRVRKAQETVAKTQLARTNNEVAEAIKAVEQRNATYFSQLDENVGGGTPAVVRVEAFMQRRYFNELSGQAVVAAKASLAAARLEARVARDQWQEAASKVKALDRLDERRREEFQIEYNRAAEAEVDDIVTGRYGRHGITSAVSRIRSGTDVHDASQHHEGRRGA